MSGDVDLAELASVKLGFRKIFRETTREHYLQRSNQAADHAWNVAKSETRAAASQAKATTAGAAAGGCVASTTGAQVGNATFGTAIRNIPCGHLANVSLMSGSAYFLGGDSYRKRAVVEDAARRWLGPLFSNWIGREEIKVRSEESRPRLKVSKRVALLEKLVPRSEEAGQVVLMGRSSGARVASLFAMRRPVKAVICFAYPFKHPRNVLEPRRFNHLASITVPTLIFQGMRDSYGAMDITENYALSPAVTVRFVDTDHDFELSSSEWDMVAQKVTKFLDSIQQQLPAEGARFDEDFYLRLHPDVAVAIASREFVSGEHHFNVKGRSQGRRFRLLADT